MDVALRHVQNQYGMLGLHEWPEVQCDPGQNLLQDFMRGPGSFMSPDVHVCRHLSCHGGEQSSGHFRASEEDLRHVPLDGRIRGNDGQQGDVRAGVPLRHGFGLQLFADRQLLSLDDTAFQTCESVGDGGFIQIQE